MAGLLSSLAQQGSMSGGALPQNQAMPQGGPAMPQGFPMRPAMAEPPATTPIQQRMRQSQGSNPRGNRQQGAISPQNVMDLARQVIMSPGGAQAIKGMIMHDGNMQHGIATAICNVTKVIQNTLQKQGFPLSPPVLAQAIIGIADLVLITVVKMGMLQPAQAKSLAHPVLDMALQLWRRSMGAAPGRGQSVQGM